MSAPQTHLDEAHKLTADALVNLWEIALRGSATGTILCFSDGPDCTWQGKTYESRFIKISNVNKNADGQRQRPTLQIMNPLGLFNFSGHEGHFDRASVTRRRVLKKHIDLNTNLSDPTYWFAGKVKEMIANQFITLELRTLSDGPNQQIPARMYVPPEFPFVTI